jgi:hypothetical protein
VVWGLVGLFQAASASPFILPAWILAAAAGAMLALVTARFDGLGADRGRVHFPASTLPLIRNMTIFLAKYGLAVAMATHPLARDQLAIWDMAVSGAGAGYFIGWTIRFVLSYRRAAASAVPAAAGR